MRYPVVVGMAIWVGQGQSHLPAHAPGIAATSGQRGQLRPPKARAGEDDVTLNRRFIKGCRVPTRATEAGDQCDSSHAWPPPTALSKPLLHERIRGKPRAYTSDMPVQGKRRFMKQPAPRKRDREKWDRCQDHTHRGADSRAVGRHTATRPPPI
jgi:hypothetical protein